MTAKASLPPMLCASLCGMRRGLRSSGLLGWSGCVGSNRPTSPHLWLFGLSMRLADISQSTCLRCHVHGPMSTMVTVASAMWSSRILPAYFVQREAWVVNVPRADGLVNSPAVKRLHEAVFVILIVLVIVADEYLVSKYIGGHGSAPRLEHQAPRQKDCSGDHDIERQY